MAEIKSTLELAMERTKKMAISDKEREAIKQKEFSQKVNALFHRYMEGLLPLNALLKEIERMDEKARTMAKEFLLIQWIDALSLNEEAEGLLIGIETLKGKEIDEVKEKLHHLLSQYREETEKIKEEARARSEDALRKEGIYGSAVEPNIEGSPSVKKELRDLDQRFGAKLKEVKEQLRIS
jgi:ElaB/YqjD/DUF883 family membrane-anchored ribosome-binding protein